MSKKDIIPTEILSDELKNAIKGRKVKDAVFTTFSFDPGFFELHILPLLFDQDFSHADKVRLIQLEDAMLAVNNIAVYYDKSAISQDAEPACLDYKRIDIRRKTGCFHPKIILLLLENPLGDGEEEEYENFNSLLFAVSSANLTRSGWWENLECAHIEEINEKEDWENVDRHYPYRKDLISLIHRIRNSTDENEDHNALDRINEFIVKHTPTKQVDKSISGGKYYSRLYCGQNSFADWLVDLRLYKREWNLEVISPFFDSSGAGPLEDIIVQLEPKETRVYVPRDHDGTALITEDAYNSIASLQSTYWAEIPMELVHRGGGHVSEKLMPRRVHAKVYRLWNGRTKNNILIVGSVNLTSSAHSHGNAGNLETAFLVDISDENYRNQWWLSRIDKDIERFTQIGPSEEDGLEIAQIDLSMRFDWTSKSLEYRLLGNEKSQFRVCEINGHVLFQIDKPKRGSWIKCTDVQNEKAHRYLISSSIFLIKHERGQWRLLVREENMAYRPSLLTQLTPEEILEYWALLSPDQRAAFIEHYLGRDEQLEGLPILINKTLKSKDTLFDRFTGIYHSFGCLTKHVSSAIDNERFNEAEALLAGSKYNSLPSLLEKTFERKDGDQIIRYVTFLSAKQLYEAMKKKHKVFFRGKKQKLHRLEELLKKLPEVRKALPIVHENKNKEFLEWFENSFLKDYGMETRLK